MSTLFELDQEQMRVNDLLDNLGEEITEEQAKELEALVATTAANRGEKIDRIIGLWDALCAEGEWAKSRVQHYDALLFRTSAKLARLTWMLDTSLLRLDEKKFVTPMGREVSRRAFGNGSVDISEIARPEDVRDKFPQAVRVKTVVEWDKKAIRELVEANLIDWATIVPPKEQIIIK